MTTSYDPAPDPSGATTQTFYDGYGTENIVQTYNIVGGQAAVDVNPTTLPGGEYIVNLNIPGLVGTGTSAGYVTDPNSGAISYTYALQYGQGTASLLETFAATGVTRTVATVHDVATMLINGQWEPVQGPINISSLGANGFDLDTGPKILTDQTGGATTSSSLELSGNVVNYLPAERFNFADGEVVNIADNGVQVGSASIHSVNQPGTQYYLGPNDTSWDSTIDLTPGNNAIMITTTDANGLTGSASLDYVYTPPGSGEPTTASGGAGGSSSGGGAGQTGSTSTTGGAGTTPNDSIAIDPDVTFLGHGAFQLTGHASSTAGVGKVELTAQVDGLATDLGAATVNADGSFAFTDHVGRNTQGFITATLTDGAGQSAAASAGYALQAGLTGGVFVARQATYDLATDEVSSVSRFRADGSRVVTVEEGGQTLTAAGGDVFQNGGRSDTTFVFNPGFGQDVVQLLRAGGADHDTLSLPASDFTSIADVLAHASQYKGTAIIQDPVTGDVLRLPGVSKGVLAHNSGVLSLHT